MVLEEGHDKGDSSKEVVALLQEIRNSLVESKHKQDQRLERIEAQLSKNEIPNQGKDDEVRPDREIINGRVEAYPIEVEPSDAQIGLVGFRLQAAPLRAPLGMRVTFLITTN
jgi:hypothetical protein